MEVTGKAGLHLLACYVTPAEIRAAGPARIRRHMSTAGALKSSTIDALVDAAVDSARAQHVTIPGEQIAADIIRDLAREALEARAKLIALDKQIEAVLDRQVIVARHRRWPSWALPLAGGTLVTLIALIWYVAPLWHLNGSQAPGL